MRGEITTARPVRAGEKRFGVGLCSFAFPGAPCRSFKSTESVRLHSSGNITSHTHAGASGAILAAARAASSRIDSSQCLLLTCSKCSRRKVRYCGEPGRGGVTAGERESIGPRIASGDEEPAAQGGEGGAPHQGGGTRRYGDSAHGARDGVTALRVCHRETPSPPSRTCSKPAR